MAAIEMKKFEEHFLSIAFFLLISAPLLFFIAGIKTPEMPILENRSPSTLSITELLRQKPTSWPRTIDRYWGDNFPFRSVLISNYMKIFEWHLATPVRYALRGSQGHLFALGTLKEHAGISPALSQAQLYARRALWAGYQSFFSDHGVRYLLVLAPDKETIVSDSLPRWVRERQKTRGWQQLKPLLEQAAIPFLALEEELKKYPHNERLYNKKVDLWHWNADGFYLVNALLEKAILGKNAHAYPERRPLEQESAGPYGVELVPRRTDYYGDIKLTHIFFTDGRYPHSQHCCSKDSGAISINSDVDNTLRVFAATDSYFFSFGGIAPNTRFGFLPLATKVSHYCQFDVDDFSYETIQKIVRLGADVVIDARCEREINAGGTRERLMHPEPILLGEQQLGNLRQTMTPLNLKVFTLHNIQKVKDKEDVVLDLTSNDAKISFPPLTTSDEGYAVVAMNLVYPDTITPVLRIREKNTSAWKDIHPTRFPRGNNLLYFQIVEKPVTSYDVELYFQGAIPFRLRLLHMRFLEQEKGTK